MRLRYRLIYGAAAYALLPVMALVMLWRGVRERGYWRAWAQRFGAGGTLKDGSLWVHAVSVGEVQACAALVRELIARNRATPLVLTTATPAGAARARALFGTQVDVRFVPFDLPGAARRFFERVRPQVALIMETELWPNLFHECRARGVPLVLASARLSARSVRALSPISRALRGYPCRSGVTVAAQTRPDAERFRALGAPAAAHSCHRQSQVRYRGDARRCASRAKRSARGMARAARSGSRAARIRARRRSCSPRIARCKRMHPEALLALAPRHPPRFAQVAAWLEREGVSFVRASERKRQQRGHSRAAHRFAGRARRLLRRRRCRLCRRYARAGRRPQSPRARRDRHAAFLRPPLCQQPGGLGASHRVRRPSGRA